MLTRLRLPVCCHYTISNRVQQSYFGRPTHPRLLAPGPLSGASPARRFYSAKRVLDLTFLRAFLKPFSSCLERVVRIELTSSAWKAEALPLDDTRIQDLPEVRSRIAVFTVPNTVAFSNLAIPACWSPREGGAGSRTRTYNSLRVCSFVAG